SPPRERTWMSSRTPAPTLDRLGSIRPPGVPVAATAERPVPVEPFAEAASFNPAAPEEPSPPLAEGLSEAERQSEPLPASEKRVVEKVAAEQELPAAAAGRSGAGRPSTR